ncbi:MAG: MGH1-like glycoside hydrolase domain-containing protein [Armatimonadota bacterium]
MSTTSCPIDLSILPRPFLSAHPEWVELHDFCWRIAAKNVRFSRGRWHMDAAWDPARNYQWVWDTCFMVLYCRYANGQFPGVQSLDNFYEMQREDGYIGMTYDMTTGEEPWPNRINPPLFAWVEWEHYRATGDASRFAHAVPHIEKLIAWIDANRRTQPHRRTHARQEEDESLGADAYQLYWFEDCGSSGMDDSPRTPRLPNAGQFFDWIDLSSQMALSFRMLANMHEVLGNAERSAYWASRAEETGRLINEELWCARTRFYHDRTLPKNYVAHKTAAGFWPILAGIVPPDRLGALVDHLQDEREFNRPTPVPTLSADDLNYDADGTYWLGGVWAPTNYMIVRGLMLAGRGDVAHEIAMRYLAAMARTYAGIEPHTVWECYCPEGDKPGLTPYTKTYVKPDFVGWTGAGPISMLIENIIGLDVNVPDRTVTWDIRLAEEHGVRGLRIGTGKADFRCRKRKNPAATASVEIRSDVVLTVRLRSDGREIEIMVPAGETVTAEV